MPQKLTSKVGIVAIGRNEGERLNTCLRSILGGPAPVVYVDSGSTDRSVSVAHDAGSEVVQLDPQVPFTAARARNSGFERLCQLEPDLVYVQFVDGDCEVVASWIENAVAFLDSHRDVAVVHGRRRERYPARSIYNTFCDIEWDTPIGEAKACGGDALIRIVAFEQAGRYREDVIAAEDNELCVRLRAAGWRIWRVNLEMTVHDAAMTRFSQWWRRTVRCGYAFAQGAHLHGALPERHFVWESRRAWLWGVWLPVVCLGAVIAFGPWGLLTWLIYPLQMMRQMMRNSGPFRQRVASSIFQVVARFPEAVGQIKFLRDRLFRHKAVIIEYK
jgi:GT2 family glycosyltransferase